jgi:hypothetical protein
LVWKPTAHCARAKRAQWHFWGHFDSRLRF